MERVDGTVHLNDSQIDILNQLRVAGGIAGSTKLKEEYKKRIREKNTRGHNAIEGQDIGEAGFGVGVEKETNTFIVNYKTGEVINKTQKVTKAGRALYTYAK